jgi:mRNA interferase MazF
VARILRGEVRWADLGERRGTKPAARRPVLILSQDVFNERSGTVTAVAITSRPQRAGFPLTLELSAPKISQVRTLSADRIGRRLGRATPEALAQVVDGLLEIVGP